jgi:hypothetical protein
MLSRFLRFTTINNASPLLHPPLVILSMPASLTAGYGDIHASCANLRMGGAVPLTTTYTAYSSA